MADREYLNVVDWQTVHADVYTLAAKIQADNFKPDLIIGIGYGGIIPSNLLYFALPETQYRVAYPLSSAPEGIEPLKEAELKGKRVLVADDLAITGDSLTEICNGLRCHDVAALATACLYCSPGYNHLDYVVRNLEPGERIVFPWYTHRQGGDLRVFKYKERFGKHEPI